ncbi:reverse transcriptase [Plakobranchus ocellatus]|uniref:Reverse transcriptase n=1 Tax=Plakobranchus ocellatus TaxID=259542 RepID=A0AAV4C263_9GAST|nr:reverse transcriptase [Plakobranchus ocellatus]
MLWPVVVSKEEFAEVGHCFSGHLGINTARSCVTTTAYAVVTTDPKGVSDGVRTRNRRVPADLRTNSLATEPPMPHILMVQVLENLNTNLLLIHSLGPFQVFQKEDSTRVQKAVQQPQQGQWTNWDTAIQRSLTWNDIWHMAPLRIRFLIRSVYDLRPSNAKLVRWGKKDEKCHGVKKSKNGT